MARVALEASDADWAQPSESGDEDVDGMRELSDDLIKFGSDKMRWSYPGSFLPPSPAVDGRSCPLAATFAPALRCTGS